MHASWYLSITAQASVLAAVFIRDAWRSWPWFAAWLAGSIARSLTLVAIGGPGSALYLQVYVVTDVPLLALYAAVVHEVWKLRCARYTGVRRVGEVILIVSLAIAAAASLIVGLRHEGWEGAVSAVWVVRRTVMVVLLVFAGLALLVTGRLRTPTPPELLAHHRLLVAYLAAVALPILLGAVAPQSAVAGLNAALTGAAAVCYLVWVGVVWMPATQLPSPAPSPQAELVERKAREFILSLRSASRTDFALRRRSRVTDTGKR